MKHKVNLTNKISSFFKNLVRKPKLKKKSKIIGFGKFKSFFRKKDDSNDKFSLFEVTVLILISILFGFIVGCILLYSRSIVDDSKGLEILDTYHLLLNNYYDEVDEDQLVNAAIDGMVRSLDDPYSIYMDNKTTEGFNETVDGSYVGIGITVSKTENGNEIVDIFDDSSAKESGLRIGDLLISVDDKDVKDMDVSELITYVKGEAGTKVNIKILRNGKEKVFVIERKEIQIPSVTSKIVTSDKTNIGYIDIDSFSANTYLQFKRHLLSLEKQNIKSLIIDVRDNPGGHLNQVSRVLELFFNKKTILYQIESKKDVKKVYSSTSEKRDYDIVVLVNAASASAAEMFASCFQESYKNATIVGITTYGKGTVQQAFSISTGSSLKYTTQKWLTSKGKWINEVGVVPDVFIEQSEEYYKDFNEENDLQFQQAIHILTKKES